MGNRFSISTKQMDFIQADADEVLYGGAAGGGKTYGQLIDALIYGGKYPRSRQLILRRTFSALEISMIPTALNLYPKQIARYKVSNRRWELVNGSVIEFGYLDADSDVIRYQSAEYDVIRFDELTHFSEYMYTYMFSRLRGSTPYPRQIKSTTNPGSVGHSWVKKRFIDPAEPLKKWDAKIAEDSEETISRIFIPAFAQDNNFLMQNDPHYLKKLLALPEKDRKALLHGDWNIFEGQFFNEWNPTKHIIKPFAIPEYWRRYVSMDYGMDMFAVLFIAVDENDRGYIYREIYLPNLLISQAAKELKLVVEQMGNEIHTFLAPPDLWNRRQETGKSVIDYFAEQGIHLVKSNNDRVSGWRSVREWLAILPNEFGESEPRLKIFENCLNIIRTLPQLQHSPSKPEDISNEPHELTHAPDALRGFATFWVKGGQKPKVEEEITYEEEIESFWRY